MFLKALNEKQRNDKINLNSIFKTNLKFEPQGIVTQFATQFIPVSRQYRA